MKIITKENKVILDFEGDTITTVNDILIDEASNDGTVNIEIRKGHWVGNGTNLVTNIFSCGRGYIKSHEPNKYTSDQLKEAIEYHIKMGTYECDIIDFDDYMKQWELSKSEV
jgi:hypothetical protein